MKELDTFDQRIIGDYGAEAVFTQQDVELMMDHTMEFVSNSPANIANVICASIKKP